MISEFIRSELETLRRAQLIREPRVIERLRGPYVTIGGRERLSFCSNDYLGLAQDPRLAAAAAKAAAEFGWGSGSARTMSGTTRWHAALEDAIAGFKRLPAALVFPSGYMANLALVTTLADRETTILSDELNHASLIDACRLSGARIEIYPHRDVAAVQRLLRNEGRRTFILTDTVFSMDGDLAPLEELRALGSDLVVDDVHGLGVFGPEGRGAVDLPIQSGNLAKAAGGVGGFVAGSHDLIELIRSRGRSFLFTTAPPPAVCAAGIEALALIRNAEDRRKRLWENIRILGARSPIHTVVLGSNERALEASRTLFDRGFFVPAIRPPSVAPGSARLRITVTAMHEREHVEALVEALRTV
ncbi:MAG TPA: 8-amino-7-oxononanoate synthase [Planctomycetota bacterium]|nr:8-amino-7-oxononanoate synthase [Planctomycetota bacterium]